MSHFYFKEAKALMSEFVCSPTMQNYIQLYKALAWLSDDCKKTKDFRRIDSLIDMLNEYVEEAIEVLILKLMLYRNHKLLVDTFNSIQDWLTEHSERPGTQAIQSMIWGQILFTSLKNIVDIRSLANDSGLHFKLFFMTKALHYNPRNAVVWKQLGDFIYRYPDNIDYLPPEIVELFESIHFETVGDFVFLCYLKALQYGLDIPKVWDMLQVLVDADEEIVTRLNPTVDDDGSAAFPRPEPAEEPYGGTLFTEYPMPGEDESSDDEAEADEAQRDRIDDMLRTHFMPLN